MRKLALYFLASAVLLFSFSVTAQRKRTPRKPPQKPPDFSKYVVKDEWLKLTAVKYSAYYYNPSKVIRMPSGTMKIWIKEAAYEDSPRWANDVFERRKGDGHEVSWDKYGALDHVLALFEVNCDKSQLRLLDLIDYSNQGDVLLSIDTTDEGWSDVVPDSIGETFANEACIWRLFDSPAKPKTNTASRQDPFFDDIPPAKPKPTP